jgi:hypothetical protein
MVVPLGLVRVEKLTENREQKIMEAYKNLNSREGWVAILGEYKLSLFLQNKVGSEGHISKDFDWLRSVVKEGTENYLKVQSGRYRDWHGNGFSDVTQRNLAMAQELMAQWQEQEREALHDRLAGTAEIGGGTVTLGRCDWYDAGQGSDGDLRGGPVIVSTGEGAGGSGVVSEEP